MNSFKKAPLATILLFLVGLSSPSVAQENNQWTDSSGDGNWFNAANWSLGRVPDATDTAVIDSSTASILTSGAASGGLVIDGGILELEGTLTTGSVTMGTQAGSSGNFQLFGLLITGQVLGGPGSGSINFRGEVRLTGDQADLFAGFPNGSGVVDFGFGFGTIDTQDFNVATSASFVGLGGLTKIGTGTLTLSGNSSNQGGTNFNQGTLALSSSGALGSTGTLSWGGGTLQYSSANTTDYSSRFSTAAGQQYNVDTNGQNVTWATALTSSGGSLTKSGSGILTLSGSNTYDGGTVVEAGTLMGDSTSLQGSIQNAATLVFNQTIDGTYGGNISGMGAFVKQGNGTLTLGGTNTYTGGTTLLAGTLQTGSTTALPSAAAGADYTINGGTLNSNNFDLTMSSLSGTGGSIILGTANLAVDQIGTTTFAGAITGMGFTKTGAGALTLSGTNNFSGSLSPNEGTLNIIGSVTNAATSGIATTGTAAVLNVTGPGASWTDTSDTLIGFNGGTGYLNISGGAVVSDTFSLVGRRDPTDAGYVTVTGAGSLWLHSQGLVLGTGDTQPDTGGLGVLNVDSGGTVEVDSGGVVGTGTIVLGENAGTSGTLNIGAAAGQAALAPGTIDAATVTGASGVAVVNFNHTGTNYTFAPNLTGNLSVEQNAGTTILTGTNTYTGGTTISGGTLGFAGDNNLGAVSSILTMNGGTLHNTDDTTISRQVVLAADSTFDVDAGKLAVNGPISGNGGLTVSGTGTLFLNNASNSYLGGTTITNGATVSLAVDSFLGKYDGLNAVLVFNGGTLTTTGDGGLAFMPVTLNAGGGTFNVNNGTWTVNGRISGDGGLTVSGPGTLVLNNPVDSYGGGTTISNGATLSLPFGYFPGGSDFSTASLVFNGGTLTITGDGGLPFMPVTLNTGGGTFNVNNGTWTVSGPISGDGGLTVSGTGTLVLEGFNSYSGGTTINDGATLSITSGSSLGFGGATINSGAILSIASGGSLGSGEATINSGAILSIASGGSLGSGGATINSGAILSIASGGSLGSGETMINSGGTLSIASGGSLGSGETTINSGATLSTASGALGDGSLIFNGGTLTAIASGSLGSNSVILNTGGGTFNVVSGTLTLNGPISGDGDLTVSGTGILVLNNSSNSYRGGATINSGATLSIASGGSLGSGETIINSGATLSTASGGLGDGSLIFNGGTLSVASSGTLNTSVNVTLNTGGGNFNVGGGTLTLNGQIDGSGGLTVSGTGMLVLDNSFNSYSGGTTINSGATLSMVSSGYLGSGDTTIDSGAMLSIVSVGSVGSGSLNFSGGTLTTTASGSLASNSVTLNEGGGTFNLAGGTLTVNGPISGSGGLTVSGTGTLILGNSSNSYGATTINSGATLSIASAGSLGSSGALIFNGGTLITTASAASFSDVVLNTEGGTFNVNNGTWTVNGRISGDGGLTVSGPGTLVLNNPVDSYGGGTTISNGATLSLPFGYFPGGSDFSTASLVFNGGTLTFTGDGGLPFMPVTLNAGGGTFNVNNGTWTVSGPISGDGGLTVSGTGTLVLEGFNSYSGGTTINDGANLSIYGGALGFNAVIFNGGTLTTLADGTLRNSIILNTAGGTFNVANSTWTVTNSISGDGGLTVSGAGTLVLDFSNSYSGGTMIDGGATLQLATQAALPGSGAVLIGSGGTLAVNAGGAGEFTNATSGVGSIGGVLSGTTFQAGSVFGIDTTNASGGTLTYAGNITYAGMGLEKLGSGTLALTGTNTYGGGTTVSGGTLNFTSDANLGAISGVLTMNGGTLHNSTDLITNRQVILATNSTFDVNNGFLTFSNPFSGSGGLTKTGGNFLTLTGSNTYAGATIIQEGFFKLESGSLATPSIDLASGTIFYLADSTGILAANITGSGAFDRSGTGTSILTGTVDQNIQVQIDSGTLQVGNGSAIGSIAGDVLDNGRLSVNHSNAYSFDGTISGAGSFLQSGSGTTTLSATNTYSGGTQINSGTLVVANNSALGTGNVNISGGILQFNLGFSAANMIMLSGGSLARQVAANTKFSSLGAYHSAISGGVPTVAQLLDGQSSTSSNIVGGFANTALNGFSAANDSARISDVFTLSGVPMTNASTGETDMFVLQLQVNPALLSNNSFLSWLNPQTNQWANAVNGNIGGTSTLVAGAYNPNADFILGDYGVDPTKGIVWAVLDHNSSFSVAAVPEPSTWILLGLGLAAMICLRRCRISTAP